MIELFIPGKPVPKGRPRMTKYGHVFTDKKTKDFEKLVKDTYIEKYGDYKLEGALKVNIDFIYLKPKTSKNKYHVVTPDLDNLIKSTLDGLNKTAFKDDSAIIELNCRKYYTKNESEVGTILYILPIE